MASKLVLALALLASGCDGMAPTATKPTWIVNGAATTAPPEPPTMDAAQVARQMLELANEKEGLQKRVAQLDEQLASEKAAATAATGKHRLELSAVESAWEKVVKTLKSQINDLSADVARVRLAAAQDAAAAAAKINGLQFSLASTESSLAEVEKKLLGEQAAARAAAEAAAVAAAKTEAVMNSLGASVSRRDAEIEALEAKGVRALSKQLAATAWTKTKAGGKKALGKAKALPGAVKAKFAKPTSAEWREACEDGVVSWYDFGMRL